MSYICQRCEFESAPDDESGLPEHEQLVQHALDWSHGLCVVCARSLPEGDPQTCEGCLQKARGNLAGILAMYTELPLHLGHPRGQRTDVTSRGSDEQPLPGGSVLNLLGPGGTGAMPRQLTALDKERGETGREHIADNRLDDPPSVAWTLATWEDDWRHTRGEPAAQSGGSTAQVVRDAHAYLEQHMRWAANQHPAFDELYDDLRKLLSSLMQATQRIRKERQAGASCFDCGGLLVHPVDEHGLENETTVQCRQCGSRYTPARYQLALRAKLEEGSRKEIDGEQYATITLLVKETGRGEQTLRNWANRGEIRRHDHAGVTLLHVGDTTAASDTKPRAEPKPASAEASVPVVPSLTALIDRLTGSYHGMSA